MTRGKGKSLIESGTCPIILVGEPLNQTFRFCLVQISFNVINFVSVNISNDIHIDIDIVFKNIYLLLLRLSSFNQRATFWTHHIFNTLEPKKGSCKTEN